MKRTILLFSFLILFFFAASSQQYYWYQHQKIPLKEDSLLLYAEFENADSASLFLQKNTSIV